MSDIDQLKESNPAETQPDWGSSVAGRAALASVLDQAEDEVALQPPTAKTPRPWVYAATGFALTLLVAVPVLLAGNSTDSAPVGGGTFPSATEPNDILDDNIVTREELELAADTTVQCVVDEGGSASWSYDDSNTYIDFLVDESGNAFFPKCEGVHFRAVQYVWGGQNAPEPAEGFYFYGAVVRCTEARSGSSFGEISQNSLGYMSTVGQRTIEAALAEEPDLYGQCLNDVSSQPLHYYFVLECLSDVVGTRYPGLTDPGHGRLTAEQITILDGARDAHPREFDNCMREVSIP